MGNGNAEDELEIGESKPRTWTMGMETLRTNWTMDDGEFEDAEDMDDGKLRI